MTVTEHTDDGVRVVGATSDDTTTTPSDRPGSAAVVSAAAARRAALPHAVPAATTPSPAAPSAR